MKRLTFPAVLAATLIGSAQAEVLNVGGPNPDANDIATAVLQASEGDVLRIYPGFYSPFVISGKSLSIIPSVPGDTIAVSGSIQINNLAAGQSVELHRIDASVGISAQNCDGSLRIFDGTFYGDSSFDQCDDVAIVSSSFTGRDGFFLPPNNDGYTGLQINNSRVALYRSSIRGGRGGDGDSGGNCLLSSHLDGGYGGSALAMSGTGELFLSLSIAQGGTGGSPDWLCGGSSGITGRGIIASNSAQFDIRMIQSVTSSQLINLPNTLTNLPGETRRLAGPVFLFDDEMLEVRLFGEPGEHAGLFYSTGHAHETAPIGGPLLVQVPMGPNWSSWHYLGRIGGSGFMDASFPMRDLPAFAHAKLHIVGVTVSSAGKHYTNSLNPLVLDTAW